METSLTSCVALAGYLLTPRDGRAEGLIWEMSVKLAILKRDVGEQ